MKPDEWRKSSRSGSSAQSNCVEVQVVKQA